MCYGGDSGILQLLIITGLNIAFSNNEKEVTDNYFPIQKMSTCCTNMARVPVDSNWSRNLEVYSRFKNISDNSLATSSFYK